jgi:hypothetical protein
MHIDIEVRHYPGSEGFMVSVWKDRKKPETKAFETEAKTIEFLTKFNIQKYTPEEILQLVLAFPPRKNAKAQKFRVTAREAAKGAAANG